MEKDQTDNPSHAPPVRLAFRVSYLGSRFFGSQMQADSRTVEGEFIAACRRLGLFDDWRLAGFQSAGRTDRGVHACGQVIAFTTPAPERAAMAMNTQLPPDCWCTGWSEVAPSFHPRYDARSRTYRYYFMEPPHDPDAMGRAAAAFIGTHDFSNFARVGDRNPQRRVLATRVAEEEGFVFFEVTAESFLWHQVRCMASALSAVGSGAMPEETIHDLLEMPSERPPAPAPAEGLILWNTDCGLCWIPVSSRERSARFVDHLRAHHALMENVCRALNAR
jgi:tRNA pseudouridine38-40 synthase